MAAYRILLATDGSRGSGEAVSLLASSFEVSRTGTVEVLSVVPPDSGGIVAHETSAALVAASRREAAERLVHGAAERLRAAGFAAVERVCHGHPAETIVEHATADEPQLILMGTRGLRGLQGQLTGSVSAKVARYAPVSVLIARAGGKIRRLLLGYDASPDAEAALATVAALPLKAGVLVTVCSVYDVPQPLMSGVAPTMVAEVRAAFRDVARWAREAATVMADNAAGRLVDRGFDAKPYPVRGKAHEQLAAAANELPADLLVVGSRGLSAIARFVLGSTSAALLAHPPTSLLVARDAARAQG